MMAHRRRFNGPIACRFMNGAPERGRAGYARTPQKTVIGSYLRRRCYAAFSYIHQKIRR